MTTPTTFPITFACGHNETRDLSQTPASKRAEQAAWLATTPCTQCFLKNKRKGPVSKEVQAKRAAEQQAAMEDAEKSGLPPLQGSDKQVSWGTRVRYELLKTAYENLVEAGDYDDADYDGNVLEKARPIDRAKWWIDVKDSDTETLLADLAEVKDSDLANENPY